MNTLIASKKRYAFAILVSSASFLLSIMLFFALAVTLGAAAAWVLAVNGLSKKEIISIFNNNYLFYLSFNDLFSMISLVISTGISGFVFFKMVPMAKYWTIFIIGVPLAVLGAGPCGFIFPALGFLIGKRFFLKKPED